MKKPERRKDPRPTEVRAVPDRQMVNDGGPVTRALMQMQDESVWAPSASDEMIVRAQQYVPPAESAQGLSLADLLSPDAAWNRSLDPLRQMLGMDVGREEPPVAAAVRQSAPQPSFQDRAQPLIDDTQRVIEETRARQAARRAQLQAIREGASGR